MADGVDARKLRVQIPGDAPAMNLRPAHAKQPELINANAPELLCGEPANPTLAVCVTPLGTESAFTAG